MKKTLILIAGPPATGKTYLVNLIVKVQPQLYKITPDELKEDIADSKGFNNLVEKASLENIVWKAYYQAIDAYMMVGKKVILSEYPFSNKQKSQLNELAKKYSYDILTVRLVADFEVLWERRLKRDREEDRHLSHIMTHYHFGDTLDNRELADNQITKVEFQNIVDVRDYNHFKLGKLLEFNVSDFSKVDYSPLLSYLAEL
ncbi:kinase [Streptococcus gallolyticus]|uniref:Kinase n=1 Tax=Streptococcus gallolyticus TaxID=315405 RepID=A0A368UF52_9STRE|nr:AAA family ATPase [Streptococcus gallolyticus]RCW17541.1 kinase [Streptococcus gallolyticus]